MKDIIFLLLIGFCIFIVGYAIGIYVAANNNEVAANNNEPISLDIYTMDNIYYVDPVNFQVSNEIYGDTISFKSMEDLNAYISKITAEESIVDAEIVQRILSDSYIYKGIDTNVLSVQTKIYGPKNRLQSSIVSFSLDNDGKYYPISYAER